MTLQSGNGELRFTDVAKRIDPTTVSFESLTDPGGTRVIEQNYQYDLVDREKLLRHVGEHIAVEQMRAGETGPHRRHLVVRSRRQLDPAQANGEVSSISNLTNIQFPSLPGGLITKPTLVWLVSTQRAGAHSTRVSYQTQGMTWWSDYNITLGGRGPFLMDLLLVTTIINQSGGASYPHGLSAEVGGGRSQSRARGTLHRHQS